MPKAKQEEKKTVRKPTTTKYQKKVIKGKEVDRKKEMLKRLDRSVRRGGILKKARERKEEDEFEVRIVSIRRVSKVKAGGKRLRMSVMVVMGDKAGRVGVAVAKGVGVKEAESKAINKAKKGMVKILLQGQTIPHEITYKFKAAKIFLRPAAPGTGVIAGDAVRSVAEVCGIKDILTKVLGTKNTVTNVYATFKALKSLKLERFKKNETS